MGMTAEDRKKAAIEETAKWVREQTKHVWRSLGVGDDRGRELNIGLYTGERFWQRREAISAGRRGSGSLN